MHLQEQWQKSTTPEELSHLPSTLGEVVYGAGGNWLENKGGLEQLSRVHTVGCAWSVLLRDMVLEMVLRRRHRQM